MSQSAAGGDEEDPSGFKSLLEVNGLQYLAPMSLSLGTSRVVREWDCPKQVYQPGETIPFPLAAGGAFVATPESSIAFTLVCGVSTTNPAALPGEADKIQDPHIDLGFFWSADPKGRGTAQNCFRSMRLSHSSGYEMDRLQDNYAEWAAIKAVYTHGSDWWSSVGTILRGLQGEKIDTLGSAPGVDPSNIELTYQIRDGQLCSWFSKETRQPTFVAVNAKGYLRSYKKEDDFYQWVANDQGFSQQMRRTPARGFVAVSNPKKTLQNRRNIVGNFGFTVDCMIPLGCVSTLFDQQQLLPPSIVSGARLEMTVANLVDIFTVRSGKKGTFAIPNNFLINEQMYAIEIHDPKIILECVTLADAAHRAVLDTAATYGLEILYEQVHTQKQPVNGANETSIAVNRGLSRAISVNIALHETDKSPAIDSVGDYYMVNRIQTKLGAEFMPSKPHDTVLKIYHATQTAWNNFRADVNNTVSLRDFVDFTALASQTLEKSSTLRQSGAPIAANRDLRIDVGIDPTPVPLGLTAYVVHEALLTGFNHAVLVRM